MPKPVILFQDGAVDELLSVALLTTMPTDEINYVGCFVVNGDCLSWPTVLAQRKILRYMHSLDPSLPTETFVFPVNCRAVNAFPWTYRQYSMMTNLLPALNAMGDHDRPASTQPAQRRAEAAERVRATAEVAGEPITFLSLGPLTPIADLMDALGSDFHDIVGEIVWMGGAIPPELGNVDPGIAVGANPNAEWNAYWDPYAVDSVFGSGVSIKLFPLNVTNDFALDQAFFDTYVFPNATSPMIDLAGQMYSTVAFEAGYCFWDTVTTAYLGRPDLFTFTSMNLTIDTDFTKADFGSIRKDPNGPSIEVATIEPSEKSDRVTAFYEYYVGQLKSVGAG